MNNGYEIGKIYKDNFSNSVIDRRATIEKNRGFMLASESYQLWYTAGVPQHELKGFRGNGIANPFNMAEYLLEMMNLEHPRNAVSAHLENTAITNYRSNTRQPIEAIHHHFKEQIRANYQLRQLTAEEFEQALFEDKLEKELEKISPKVEVTIECGK